MAKQVLKISSIHESGIESEGLGEQSDGDCDSYLFFSRDIMRIKRVLDVITKKPILQVETTCIRR